MTLIDLSGKVALLTGGGRGIGAATATLLARAGAAVAITYRERRGEAEAVVRELREEGKGKRETYGAVALQADLARRDDAERVVRQTVEQLGGLDILVANHGVWPPADVPLTAMSDQQWRRTLGVNLDGVFYVVRAGLREMTGKGEAGKRTAASRAPRTAHGGDEGWGRVVIVSSTAGQRGEGYHADYAASKGAIISFVKSLCVEAAPAGITVNSVAPGWVDTEMSQGVYERGGGEGRREIERTIPLGRVARPEEIAGAIVFLCCDLASGITGEILNVNGGSVLCG